jgi:hypothetical protein
VFAGSRRGFVYAIGTKTFTELTIPNQTYVEVWGVNDKGVVALDGTNPTGVFIGYLYCPRLHDCPAGAVAIEPRQGPALHPVIPIMSPNLP